MDLVGKLSLYLYFLSRHLTPKFSWASMFFIIAFVMDANQNPNANVHFGGVSGDKFTNESESRILALFAEHRQRRIPTTSRAADYGP